VPLAVRISPKQMSKQDYERMLAELEASGLSEPEGRLYHAAYGDDGVEIFEVWRSQEDFEAHRDRTFAALQGTTVGSFDVQPLHSEHPD
jgi:quinol monooxygenase YgiN